ELIDEDQVVMVAQHALELAQRFDLRPELRHPQKIEELRLIPEHLRPPAPLVEALPSSLAQRRLHRAPRLAVCARDRLPEVIRLHRLDRPCRDPPAFERQFGAKLRQDQRVGGAGGTFKRPADLQELPGPPLLREPFTKAVECFDCRLRVALRRESTPRAAEPLLLRTALMGKRMS